VVKTSRIVRPRPPTLTSIPALLATFQNEWDALALETYTLKEQLARAREELATALYQHDAAVRVIARLTKEREEARDALSRLTVSAGAGAGADGVNGEGMQVDSVETLPEHLATVVDETHQSLSKSRKKRPTPKTWVTSAQISAFGPETSNSLPVTQATSMDLQGNQAAVGGLKGEAAIYDVDTDKLERQLPVGEPVTDTLWCGSKVVFATSQGALKLYDGGKEVASLSEHAGPATALSAHPSGQILASVGSDKSIVLYDLSSLARVSRVYTDACKFADTPDLAA
jgi:pre-mRNA-processing factor 19